MSTAAGTAQQQQYPPAGAEDGYQQQPCASHQQQQPLGQQQQQYYAGGGASLSPARTGSEAGDADSVRRRGGPGREWVRRTVVVMQFNVLAKIYEPDHLPGGQCRFENRCASIASQIEYHAPDVVCLQEANPISWYRHRFGDWYDIAFASKADRGLAMSQMLGNDNDIDDGAAIMVRKGAVEFVNLHHIRVRDPAPTPQDPIACGPNFARQFALLAECRHLGTGQTFFVANMHMKCNNGDSNECPRRVCHLAQVLPAMNQIRKASPAPMIFAGDFNSPPGTPTLDFLLRGKCSVHGKNVVSPTREVRWQSAMAGTGPGGADPEFTILCSSWGEAWSSILDYILFEADCFTVTGFVSTPALATFGSDAVPHSGSDHIPLIAELAFRPGFGGGRGGGGARW
uniref:Endonuclease/exonuclease/phosphatase domain-containing protein n=1 Tax=Neobodo designis TaxID=312471 RepID=A0A7S1PQ37_NEODS|mmetsp:Transcript_15652/g.48479  ORF Transcript_15652/g.48479 Transcript_15652/m.48479 type:complete len:399 (+) Transcript_15652:78-1274(+)